MLYNNNSLRTVGDGPINGKCFFSDVPFNGYVSIREYQKKVLEVLNVFDNICKKYDITYFLMYGTLMGAVRHKGFIPWDDDVDVIMSRENYNKFREACKKELDESYVLVDAFVSKNYTFTYGRLRKKDTTYIINCEIANNYCSGIYIDIIYYDYLSDNKLFASIQKRTYRNYNRLVSFGYSQFIYHVSYFEEYFFLFLSKIIGRNNLLRVMEKIMSLPKQENSSKVMLNMLIPSVNLLDELDKKYFEKPEWVDFEGELKPIPQKADELLDWLYCQEKIKRNCTILPHVELKDIPIQERMYYADYQFVPLNKSNPRHGRVAFDFERPSEYYTQYYEKVFNRKENNRNAIKDRRYRERAAKYGVRLNKVSENVFLAIQELNTARFFEDNRARIAEEIANEQYAWFTENIFALDLLWQNDIKQEVLNYTYEIMLLAGEFEYALRIKNKRSALYPELNGDELDSVMDIEIRAWYAMCDGKYEVAKTILDAIWPKWNRALIFKMLEMMVLKAEAKYEECLEIAEELIYKNHNLFIALYCKGVCLHKVGKYKEAEKYICEALNSTLFMPYIQKALDYLKLLEESKNESDNVGGGERNKNIQNG